MYIVAGGGALCVFAIGFLIALVLRKVVPTNEVHIVQRGRFRVSYGASQSAGNVYQEWPVGVGPDGSFRSAHCAWGSEQSSQSPSTGKMPAERGWL